MRQTDEGEQVARRRRLQVNTSASPPPAPPPPSNSELVSHPARARAQSRHGLHGREIGTERRRRKRPTPTLALAPSHYTALAPLVDGRISIFFVHLHLRVLIIFINAIHTPAVRDIGDEWRERDRVGHSVDNAAPTTAGMRSCARERLSRRPGRPRRRGRRWW
ncbi:hypothetical protein B0H14DRAFT_2903090 [Mycena olivaceomarginata]|nr:hypothetical protein B0H14DRAFT_2903090 [Mycena olivaceomarginata]